MRKRARRSTARLRGSSVATVINININMSINSTRTLTKNKGQHIQVFVRVRPINDLEQTNKSTTIVEVANDKEIVVRERPKEKYSKKFKFDNVFGPSAKQVDVYNAVVSPLLEQVLAGYNCTVFAYGQTGTGKTFTMEGINRDPTLHWRKDTTAGMIPRSLSHLFDELQLLQAQEYTIRVSFLELYNEELFDLLSTNDDGSKIKLYEDTSKKGAVIIHGLEEITIHSKSEVHKFLQMGLERRQTATTLMNASSSRSHTVFSITVHMKENTPEGEEVLKTGKLNLVDLAGSENVGRSGSIDRRAREAGCVNQSLLTLGRVITALVEGAPHIPYRESKLTRLLQESLGGRTKTSIIATISPASINLEETLSTLDYAHRAKNITNRPEINLKLSKKEFLKKYTAEIERLRRDLIATRDKTGIYVPNDDYNEMQALLSQQSKELEEKNNQIKALEKMMDDKEEIYNELKLQTLTQMEILHEVKAKLDNTTDALKSTHDRLKVTVQERDEQKYLVETHVNTEKALLLQGQSLLNVADTATEDSQKLHEKIDRKTKAEREFEIRGEEFRKNICKSAQDVEKYIREYEENSNQFCTTMKNDIGTEIVTKCRSINTEMQQSTVNLTDQHLTTTNNLTTNINEFSLNYQNWIKNEMQGAVNMIDHENEFLNTVVMELTENIDGTIESEVADKLQLLKDSLLEKINKTKIYLNEMIDDMIKRELKAYECTTKNITDIMKEADNVCKMLEFTETQRSFAKMMEDVSNQFNFLCKSQAEHYDLITDKCGYISEICNKVNDNSIEACNTSVKMTNSLKQQIQHQLERIESDAVIEAEKNVKLANSTTEQGKCMVNELKSDLNISNNVLKQYKNLVEHNTEEVQQKMNEDKNETLSLLKDMNNIVLAANKNHIDGLKDEESKVSNSYQDISCKLDNLIVESSTCFGRNIEQLHTVVDEINKFFDVEIQHYVPTGTTPAKKEFSYPRQFTITSPHERILQRFRETRKLVESAENDDSTFMDADINMTQIANSTALSDVTLINNNECATSTLSNDHLRSTSTLYTSSTSSLSRISLDSRDSHDEFYRTCLYTDSTDKPELQNED
ncbi:kinesin-like protein Klp61F isoform X1 [Hylaeus anthracinus]|uniref:kinesin-like protein Klp61F isoform X1 n=1 Tax=Hylaeus anthracinus TaxID=313031 RepID=UPI0023B9D922|nr:kinesin-like protein Klp61F isoform X1 [Hylaeus anthracinus]